MNESLFLSSPERADRYTDPPPMWSLLMECSMLLSMIRQPDFVAVRRSGNRDSVTLYSQASKVSRACFKVSAATYTFDPDSRFSSASAKARAAMNDVLPFFLGMKIRHSLTTRSWVPWW